jgi:type II secretory pathway pseudopilin PulG
VEHGEEKMTAVTQCDSRRSAEAGFTFIELILALAILVSAITVFIGLQAAAVQRTLRDRNVQQAMLVSRQIMAFIETDPTRLDQGNISPTPVIDLLSQFGAPAIRDDAERAALSPLTTSLTVEDWPIPAPKMEERPMRKLTLWVAWGSEIEERFQLVFFIPTLLEAPPQ